MEFRFNFSSIIFLKTINKEAISSILNWLYSGYMSLEYAMGGMFFEKSNGYSFGFLELEIISGKENTIFYCSDQHIGFLAYVSSHSKS